MKLGALILAAGAAKRMQSPKMLLPFLNGSILSHILHEVKAINPTIISVITGSYHKEILQAGIAEEKILLYNPFWEKGMAASIAFGVEHLLEAFSLLEGILIVVSDQPYINRALLNEMLEEKVKGEKNIIAAQYGLIKGTPVLFGRQYFGELQKLQGDVGAKSILQQFPEDIATIDFPLGAIDIDTPEDFQKLIQ
jgi:molybdenum cofactor cytidylyltransferase